MDLQAHLSTTNQFLKNAFKAMTDDVQMCIQNCTVCHQVCTQLINHCLSKGGEHMAPAHIRTLMDCAEICQTAANFMMRDSSLHTTVCRVCAEACRTCIESCEGISDLDDQMKNCINICKQCAESCEKMSTRH